MCYALPGPRCENHSLKAITNAKRAQEQANARIALLEQARDLATAEERRELLGVSNVHNARIRRDLASAMTQRDAANTALAKAEHHERIRLLVKELEAGVENPEGTKSDVEEARDALYGKQSAMKKENLRRRYRFPSKEALREAIEEAFVEAPKYTERTKELRRLSDRTRGALDSEAERRVVEHIASDSFNALYDAYEVGIFNVGVESLPELAAAKYRKFTGMRPIGDDFEDFKEGYIAQFWKDCEYFLPRHLDGLRKYREGIARMESIYADATKVSA